MACRSLQPRLPQNQNSKPAEKPADYTNLWNAAEYEIKDNDILKCVDNANFKLHESDEV
jgi:hypothetical protein